MRTLTHTLFRATVPKTFRWLMIYWHIEFPYLYEVIIMTNKIYISKIFASYKLIDNNYHLP